MQNHGLNTARAFTTTHFVPATTFLHTYIEPSIADRSFGVYIWKKYEKIRFLQDLCRICRFFGFFVFLPYGPREGNQAFPGVPGCVGVFSTIGWLILRTFENRLFWVPLWAQGLGPFFNDSTQPPTHGATLSTFLGLLYLSGATLSF